MPPKNLEKEKMPRCPKGEIRDKKTGECVKKEIKEPEKSKKIKEPEKSKEIKEPEKSKAQKTQKSLLQIMQSRKKCIQKMRQKLQTKTRKIKV